MLCEKLLSLAFVDTNSHSAIATFLSQLRPLEKYFFYLKNGLEYHIMSPRGCPIIIRTDILHHTSKTIAPIVKSQARGQNNWSRALK